MEHIFADARSFTSNLSSWSVFNVTNMFGAFSNAHIFTSDLSSWDVSQVTDMGAVFWNAHSFNSNLSSWNVSNVIDMFGAFNGASSFTSDLSNWDVSQVTVMVQMFRNANSFTSDLSRWNVSNVWSMDYMFNRANSFNSDLSNWDVSRVGNVGIVVGMLNMFSGATSFNSDLSSWNVSSVWVMDNMFNGASSFSAENYDALLTGWSSLPTLRNYVRFGVPPTTYCAGKAGREILTGTYGWYIYGDRGEDCSATSVDDEFLSNTKIYPNPSNGNINIESSFEIDKLELYNILGAKIFSVSKTNTLNLTSLKQGIYILKVFSEDRVFAKKVVKD